MAKNQLEVSDPVVPLSKAESLKYHRLHSHKGYADSILNADNATARGYLSFQGKRLRGPSLFCAGAVGDVDATAIHIHSVQRRPQNMHRPTVCSYGDGLHGRPDTADVQESGEQKRLFPWTAKRYRATASKRYLIVLLSHRGLFADYSFAGVYVAFS